MLSDLRFAFRQLVNSPGFSVVAVLTLALGVGLNTSMFSLTNALFFRPLAYPQSEQLVRVYRTTPQSQSAAHTVANYLDLERESAATIRLAVFRIWSFTLSEPGRPARMLNGLRVSADYFPVLGLPPELGRLFTTDEDRAGAAPVAIISHQLWETEFGSDPSVIGRSVRIESRPTTIVGVMPASFDAFTVWGPAEVFVPVRFTNDERRNRVDAKLDVIGRCAPGVTRTQAQARLRAIAAQLVRAHPAQNDEQSIRLQPLHSAGIIGAVDTLRQISWFNLALAASVLLITCANLANLELVRALRRAREYAVCSALGASRFRLIRPIFCECLLVAFAGGAAGLLVSMWVTPWLAYQFNQAGFPVRTPPIDGRVLGYAFGAALATGLLFGGLPAWLISHLQVNEVLKSGARGSAGSRGQSRLRDALVVTQFAFALVLLAGAGFFQRGASRLLSRDPGWQPTGILQGTIALPTARYSAPSITMDFYRRLQERLAALPGVERVAIGWTLPIFRFLETRGFVFEGRAVPPAGREPIALTNGITPSYLDTLRIKLLAGRTFNDTDDLRAPLVVLINESMARAFFPHENAVGHRLRLLEAASKQSWCEIVGVVGDVRCPGNPGAPGTPFQIYRPLAQVTWTYATLAIRCTTAPDSLADSVRRTVAGLDSDIPVQGLATAPDTIAGLIGNFTLGASVLAGLAGLGLFLAAIGIYGVLANLVVQRTPEIGVRLALGASISQTLWLILGTGLRLAAIGVLFGLAGTYALARLLRSVAPGLPAQDPLVAVAVTAALVSVAVLACWLPARRATKVNPLEALRAE